MGKLLIAPKCQYGYNTDYYQMANRLAEKGISVEVVCFDQGYRKLDPPDNVHVKYVPRTANKAGNYTRHVLEIAKTFMKHRKSLDWAVVSSTIELSGILPFLLKLAKPQMKWIMDIRTCSVVPSKKKRQLNDLLTLHSSRFFDRVTVVSELVAKRMNIFEFNVLPLGAECYIDLKKKQLDPKNINFLYVGTFDGRRIEDLIQAFDIVKNKLAPDVKSRFDIVGYGEREAVTLEVTDAIGRAQHKDSIVYHGRKSHKEIHELFETATIGFSYVPQTDFFDVQPPTKTYEYIMNGIVCIGTNTKANAQIIYADNGVLTEDNVDSLVQSIEQTVARLGDFNSLKISRTVSDSKWENIVSDFHLFLKRLKSETSAETTVSSDVKEPG